MTSGVKGQAPDTTVSGLKTDVDTKDGVVTLNGTVASRAEADRAVSLERETNGVKRVVNNLRVGGSCLTLRAKATHTVRHTDGDINDSS